MTLYSYYDSFLFLRHRVVTAAAPRIASQDSPDGQSQAFNGSMFDDGFLGILRTGGREAA